MGRGVHLRAGGANFQPMKSTTTMDRIAKGTVTPSATAADALSTRPHRRVVKRTSSCVMSSGNTHDTTRASAGCSQSPQQRDSHNTQSEHVWQGRGDL